MGAIGVIGLFALKRVHLQWTLQVIEFPLGIFKVFLCFPLTPLQTTFSPSVPQQQILLGDLLLFS